MFLSVSIDQKDELKYNRQHEILWDKNGNKWKTPGNMENK